MGVSTDAILAYGIDLGSEEDEKFSWKRDGDSARDWADEYAERKGLKAPEVEYTDETAPLFRKYWADRAKLTDASGVDVIYHCSYDFPMRAVIIRGSDLRAHRGYPVVVDRNVKNNPGWRDQLKEFCDFMGLNFKEPKWLLMSLWG